MSSEASSTLADSAQAEFGMLGSEALQKILRRHARPAAEQPVEMGLVKAGGGGEIAKRGLGGMVFVQITNHGGNTFKIIHGRTI